MSQADKVEVMDLLINVLKDHEKSLDTLITRAEEVIDDNPAPQMVAQNSPPLKITLRDWDEFKDCANEAELICFDMKDSLFLCNAITKNKVFSYSESTPEVIVELGDNQDLVMKGLNISNLEEENTILNGKLDLGLDVKSEKVKHNFDGTQRTLQELNYIFTKNWLSHEIGIHRDFVVHGVVD